MSFFGNLLFGIIGSSLLDEADRHRDQRILDREQERKDSLFWQDAARKDSKAFIEDDDDFLGLL